MYSVLQSVDDKFESSFKDYNFKLWNYYQDVLT